MSDQVTQAAAPAAAPNPVVTQAAQKVAAGQPLSMDEGKALLRDRRASAGESGVHPDPARTDAPKGNPFSDAGRKLNDAKRAKAAHQGDDQGQSQVQEPEEGASPVEDDSQEHGETRDDLKTADGESSTEAETHEQDEHGEAHTIDLGEGVKVTKDEIRDGLMMKADYTRKTQALSQERTQFEQDRQQRLGLLDTILEAQAQALGKPMNLRQHLEADPMNGQMNYAVQQERFEQLGALRQARAAEQAHDNAQRKQATIKALAEKHGDKAESHYNGAVTLAAEYTGLPAEYLSVQMAHPALADIVYDAKRWRDLQANKGNVQRTIADKPRVTKPGARVSQQSAQDRQIGAAHAKLKSSGNLADAVALLRTLRSKGGAR